MLTSLRRCTTARPRAALACRSVSDQPRARPAAAAARDPRPRAVAAGAGHGALARGALRALAGADARRPTPRSRELRERGSPSHDGVAARLVDYRRTRTSGIAIELQPLRWALRLVAGDASQSVAALCVTRSADGRWLAGRRAAWVASWAGRWALGAGGAVDLGENPADTLVRELQRGVVGRARARARRGAGAAAPPAGDVRRPGLARRGRRREVTPDHEHDAFAWWPREIDDWPRGGRRGAAARWRAGCRE